MSADGEDPRFFGEDDDADTFAVLGAAVDQFIEVQKPNARAAWGVFAAYTDAGFTEERAFAVVMEYVRSWAA